MRKAHVRGVLAIALLAAGCGVNDLATGPSAGGDLASLTPDQQAALASKETTARYNLQIAALDDVSDVLDEVVDEVEETVDDVVDEVTDDDTTGATEVAKLTATLGATTSVRNATWFGPEHLMDGKLTSAWGPRADDADPSITLNLAACATVTALGLKHSGDVTFDVAVAKGGAWTTVMTGATAQAATLDLVELETAADAEQIKLTFHGNTRDLLVCEVEVFGRDCGGGGGTASPTPMPSASASATPTTTPTAAPTDMPTTTPTDMPSEQPTTTPTTTPTEQPTTTPTTEPSTPPVGSCDCFVTGGGWIELGAVAPHKVSFGFTAKGNAEAKGQIQVVDHLTKTKWHGTVDAVICNGASVTFSGKLKSGLPFTATVTDNGEPGDADLFAFTAADVTLSGELGGVARGGGNIQVHRSDCN